jgi:hypothetical protein
MPHGTDNKNHHLTTNKKQFMSIDSKDQQDRFETFSEYEENNIWHIISGRNRLGIGQAESIHAENIALRQFFDVFNAKKP